MHCAKGYESGRFLAYLYSRGLAHLLPMLSECISCLLWDRRQYPKHSRVCWEELPVALFRGEIVYV